MECHPISPKYESLFHRMRTPDVARANLAEGQTLKAYAVARSWSQLVQEADRRSAAYRRLDHAVLCGSAASGVARHWTRRGR
jgi:hypothetical protein